MKCIYTLCEVLCWCLLLSAGACTAELDETSEAFPSRPEVGRPSSEGTRPFNLQVRNKLATGATETRADGSIALNAENEITAMDLYVFGSESEFGTYTFQEKLSYRAGQQGMPQDGATPFVLVTSGTDNAYSSARLEIKKGLYVKLYCVANAPKLYVLNKADKAYEPAKLTPLVMEMVDSEMKVKTPGTPEKDFLSTFVAQPLEATNPEDVIRTPLLMVGSMAGCISLTDYTDNSIINTSLKLTRGVVRFDVQNVAEKSRLIIESLSLTKGHATTTLFPLEAKPSADGSLLDYPQKFFYGGANDPINKGLQEAAFYSFAAPQEACLLLSGTYTAPGGDLIPVKYEVPFHNLKDGSGQKIHIQPNHRYTVKVTDADPYEVKLSISVADWEEGGLLEDFKPSDEEGSGMSELSTSSVTNLSSCYIYDNKSYYWVGLYAAGGGDRFRVKLLSNSAIDCRMKFGADHTAFPWLDVKQTREPTSVGNQWTTEYTFTFSVSAKALEPANVAKTFQPVQINFMSVGGITRTIWVENLSYTLDGKTLQNGVSYGDQEYWYFDKDRGTWDQAMEACPNEQGWYLISMNDFRNLFRIDRWDALNLPFGTQAYHQLFNQTEERSVYNGYLTIFHKNIGHPGYPGISCSSQSDLYKSNYNYGSYYDYYWSADAFDFTTARAIQLRAYTYSSVWCTKNSKTGRFERSYSYGHNSSYISYQKAAKSDSRRIRCVKRRRGNLVYPY